MARGRSFRPFRPRSDFDVIQQRRLKHIYVESSSYVGAYSSRSLPYPEEERSESAVPPHAAAREWRPTQGHWHHLRDRVSSPLHLEAHRHPVTAQVRHLVRFSRLPRARCVHHAHAVHRLRVPFSHLPPESKLGRWGEILFKDP